MLGALLRGLGAVARCRLVRARHGSSTSPTRATRQVGYFRVTGDGTDANPGSLAWDVGWREDRLPFSTMNQGIEILRMKGGADGAAACRV